MRRPNPERNKLIIKRIEKGDYLMDIAKDFGLSPAWISRLKKKYLKTNK